MKPQTITREDLYEKVWSLPTSRLKEELGISDVAIAKICKKLNVPKPPRGYWSKLQHGQKIPRTPLPPQGDAPARATIAPAVLREPRTVPIPQKKSPATPPTAFSKDPGSTIHPLVKKTQQALLKGKESGYQDYGRVRPSEPGCLNVNISKAQIGRAMNVLDTLIKGLEKQGHQVAVGDRLGWRGQVIGKNVTFVLIGEQQIEFFLEEPSIRHDHVPTKQERQGLYQRRWDYTPSGKLRLMLSYNGDGLRRSWTIDEDVLAETLASFYDGVLAAARTRQAWDLKWKRREAEEARRKELEVAEARRVQTLTEGSQALEEVSRYRRFVEAVETAATRTPAFKHESALGRWITWAKNYIDAKDPVRQLLRQELIKEDPPSPR